MRYIISQKRTGVVIFLCLVFLAAAFLSARTSAQTILPAQAGGPKLFVSWSSEGYAPSLFRGKIMPTAGSPIGVAFEVIDGGKIADLSKQTIYWYLNNKLISNLPGNQKVEINAPATAPGTITIRIELPDYPRGLLSKTVSIPIAQSEAVIRAPYPGKEFRGTAVRLKAAPYFFGTPKFSELNYRWTVNGKIFEYEENPDELTVNINPDAKPGSALNIGVYIENQKNKLDTASKNISLKFVK